MELSLSPELLAFRDRLRRHIAEYRPAMARPPGTRSPRSEDLAEFRRWCASLFEAGFIGHDWPEAWGGTGHADPLKDYVVDTELARARVPRPIGAYTLISRPLLAFGTPEQRTHYLPAIRSFAHLWCQLFSEPDAGSDLAALRTRARRDGDDWVIDGRKVWTTHGHIADFGFLLARTDMDASKHRGISAFIVDMTSPGIEVRPLREVTGSSDFNEVTFTDVRIPGANIIGKPGQGWEITRAALADERALAMREDSVMDSVGRLTALADGLTNNGQSLLDDPGIRQNIGRLAARARVTELLGLRDVKRSVAGTNGPADAAMMKVLFSEVNYDIAKYAVDIQGSSGVAVEGDPYAIADGRWQESHLWSRGYTISAGSNEVMRNLIAENGLGLPREPRAIREGSR